MEVWRRDQLKSSEIKKSLVSEMDDSISTQLIRLRNKFSELLITNEIKIIP